MLREFLDAGYRVIGLHRFTGATCACGNAECRAAGKHPIMSNWPSTPLWDDEQLETFDALGHFAQGYGVLVSGLLVIDVDARNGGIDSFARLVARIPAISGAGLIVETGSGGGSRHLYFRAPPDVALVSHLPEFGGIDCKSSGFVVGPGSQHASGGIYRAVVGSVADIDLAPPALISLLRKPDVHRATVGGEVVDVPAGQVESMLAAIDPDCGHDDWIRVGMALHDLTGGTGFGLWDTWSRKGAKYPGQSALDARWHSFGKSPNPVRFGSLVRIAIASGWQMPVTFPGDDAADDASPTDATTDAPAAKPRHVRWLDELLEDDDAAIARILGQQWLIDGLIPAGGTTGIIGESGVGKTFAVLDIAMAIASAQQYHGRATETPGTVIYVSAEGAAGLRLRKRAWEQHHATRVPSMRILGDAPLIDDARTTEQLVATVLELVRRTRAPIALIVLDTLNRVMSGEENSATAVGAVLRACDALRHATGGGVAIVHHMGHAGTRARGSSAIFAGLDTELTITSGGGGEHVIEVKVTKQKDAEPAPAYRLRLDRVTLDGITDRNGRPITTLVPATMTMLEDGASRLAVPSDLATLLDLLPADGSVEGWRDAYRRATPAKEGEDPKAYLARTRNEVWRAVDRLRRSGHIRVSGDRAEKV